MVKNVCHSCFVRPAVQTTNVSRILSKLSEKNQEDSCLRSQNTRTCAFFYFKFTNLPTDYLLTNWLLIAALNCLCQYINHVLNDLPCVTVAQSVSFWSTICYKHLLCHCSTKTKVLRWIMKYSRQYSFDIMQIVHQQDTVELSVNSK